MDLAAKRGAKLLPVDSEHSAIFQAMHGPPRDEVARVVLTASGGPFRGKTRGASWTASRPSEALRHPTWRMGPKITVDSATLMNKALEVIEARWLFGLRAGADRRDHPPRIDRPLVRRVRRRLGAGPALAARHAAADPVRPDLPRPGAGPGEAARLARARRRCTSSRPTARRSPPWTWASRSPRRGGTCGAVLNAANEAAVERFLAGELAFLDIARCCRAVLDSSRLRSPAHPATAPRRSTAGPGRR